MDMKPNVLIYGPDCASIRFLQESFWEQGVEAKLCSDEDSAYRYYCESKPLVCILHEFSSSGHCFHLAKLIHNHNSDKYLVFIFKHDKMENFRRGYQLGADDCLMIPYDIDELMVRLRAMIRRRYEQLDKAPDKYNLGQYCFDSQKGILCLDKSKIHLTTREADLLSLLCKKMNETVSKDDALSIIWSAEELATSRVFSNYIFKLRRRLKNDPSVQIITQHGKGYKLTVNSVNRMAVRARIQYLSS